MGSEWTQNDKFGRRTLINRIFPLIGPALYSPLNGTIFRAELTRRVSGRSATCTFGEWMAANVHNGLIDASAWLWWKQMNNYTNNWAFTLGVCMACPTHSNGALAPWNWLLLFWRMAVRPLKILINPIGKRMLTQLQGTPWSCSPERGLYPVLAALAVVVVKHQMWMSTYIINDQLITSLLVVTQVIHQLPQPTTDCLPTTAIRRPPLLHTVYFLLSRPSSSFTPPSSTLNL